MATHSIMISYADEDQPIAEKLRNALREKGIDCWVAYENIRPGQSWPAVISDAINQCEYFLLILTSNSNGSKQVERELAQADSLNKKLYCFQTADFPVSSGMRYFFSSIQRLEAHKYGFEKALDIMIRDISTGLNLPDTDLQKKESIKTSMTVPATEKIKPRKTFEPKRQNSSYPKVKPEKRPQNKMWIFWATAVITIIIVLIFVLKNSGNSGYRSDPSRDRKEMEERVDTMKK